ncbi:hypothetical protein [Mycobacteroides abscessus]|uniref:hypothetical protein n=1 Tax=Mycobacteroides abscessus TaxID=36809 RepID=UPI00092A0C57|nr:hypothetical protein [Mycobacteroides abscessus]MDO2978443.1 hypothetical protein [Mycobacteroides abscessus subsp. abscessus]SHP14550.1 Uncharacterised protein [Mycobacteroides abscessus subsp. abscessus]SHU09688.1 Uncharacterised protein [Mycobacteroides abscessus subsp. abscessus]SHW46782.1 Uncharacterised protein [Mycobacteroides abscessus subsp. abscessus]SHW47677.1 Uncharacterised protein [Mycobacteroides abscessus subsp. abscessus]
MPDPTATQLANVVGANCRRIRTEASVTQNVLAFHAREFGLRWTASKVGDFEAGRATPALSTVLALTAALSAATRTDVSLPDLLTFDGYVALTDIFDPTGAALVAILRGERSWSDLTADDVLFTAKLAADPNFGETLQQGFAQLSEDLKQYPDLPVKQVAELSRRFGLAEDRLAKRLNTNHYLLAAASWQLWQRTFSEERDRRAGPDANQQKRGQIARSLQAELERELAHGDDK